MPFKLILIEYDEEEDSNECIIEMAARLMENGLPDQDEGDGWSYTITRHLSLPYTGQGPRGH